MTIFASIQSNHRQRNGTSATTALAMITMYSSASKCPKRSRRNPRKDSGIVSGLDAASRGWMQFSRGGGMVRPASCRAVGRTDTTYVRSFRTYNIHRDTQGRIGIYTPQILPPKEGRKRERERERTRITHTRGDALTQRNRQCAR